MGEKQLAQDEGGPEDWSEVAVFSGAVRWASLRKRHLSEDWEKVRELMR